MKNPPLSYPTKREWSEATLKGFRSNGATMSPDTIYLVSIANGDNTYPPLPADLHDYRYWSGGTEADRLAADREFMEFMFDIIEERHWRWMRPLARRRALTYYDAVRAIGDKFFNYREETKDDDPGTGDPVRDSGGSGGAQD